MPSFSSLSCIDFSSICFSHGLLSILHFSVGHASIFLSWQLSSYLVIWKITIVKNSDMFLDRISREQTLHQFCKYLLVYLSVEYTFYDINVHVFLWTCGRQRFFYFTEHRRHFLRETLASPNCVHFSCLLDAIVWLPRVLSRQGTRFSSFLECDICFFSSFFYFSDQQREKKKQFCKRIYVGDCVFFSFTNKTRDCASLSFVFKELDKAGIFLFVSFSLSIDKEIVGFFSHGILHVRSCSTRILYRN